jgi:uncharacterized protein
MTARRLQPAFALGYERMAAWSDLLDAINVYPVADADTGRNLVVSLAPLHRFGPDPADTVRRLLVSATGNSGNIACGFFAGFIGGGPAVDLPTAARTGRDRARQAIADPMPGTMLTVLDELVRYFEEFPHPPTDFPGLADALERAVHSTGDTLPDLQAAGVVDAGALGLFLFMEGFFGGLDGRPYEFRPVTEMFGGKCRLPAGYTAGRSPEGACVDTVVRVGRGDMSSAVNLTGLGSSLVVQRDEERVKIHIHTRQPGALRKALERTGEVERWSEGDLTPSPARVRDRTHAPAIHIVTDGAGSITREEADELGITLLSSYILVGNRSLVETLVAPEELYRSMRAGVKVTTAQASVFERHQSCQSLLGRYDRVLYLCVGSVYTGNHAVVSAWKRDHDPGDRLTVIDTGLASGRLGVVARATARAALEATAPEQVIGFARAAVLKSEEYIFLDRLRYLAAGGRLSKTGGFLGDLLQVKPVITPTPQGAVKVGTARTRRDQLEFALSRLDRGLPRDAGGLILLEYSDTREWVRQAVLPEIRSRFAKADVTLCPLSLTSGAHMGPGTWGVAFLPDLPAAGAFAAARSEIDRHARA